MEEAGVRLPVGPFDSFFFFIKSLESLEVNPSKSDFEGFFEGFEGFDFYRTGVYTVILELDIK